MKYKLISVFLIGLFLSVLVVGAGLIYFDDEPETEELIMECLVKTSDNTGGEDVAEEQRGNYKAGYIILCKDREYKDYYDNETEKNSTVRKEIWGKQELNPNKFMIVSILKSLYNESWLEPEYDLTKPEYEGEGEDRIIVGYEIKTKRKYVLPLDFLNSTEKSKIDNTSSESSKISITKFIADINITVIINNYTKLINKIGEKV